MRDNWDGVVRAAILSAFFRGREGSGGEVSLLGSSIVTFNFIFSYL